MERAGWIGGEGRTYGSRRSARRVAGDGMFYSFMSLRLRVSSVGRMGFNACWY